ncbi:MAG TPA: class I SAM-dependent methyltransferase [Solirubrobacteraceae bacterium]|jgi:O-methyltransferase involved in polyketide biosynthesis|nr:class I SAM-dependent methyltransferase [Solirubrobacteraceae bacterium]
MSGSDNISPTAHYTGEVWRRNGLSHPWLGTAEGRVMYDALHPVMAASAAAGAPSLETYLLARHRAIDALLQAAIERHGVSQVIEIAAGLSPRGWRFANRYGDRLIYVEADLPAMAARKRRALARIGSLSAEHRVVELDALHAGGPQSLEAAAVQLDRSRGLAIITEGLLGYLETGAVVDLWTRFHDTLDAFPTGRYISDLHLGSAITPAVRAFRLLLSAFVRGGVHLHFHDAAEAEDQLRACGFATAAVRPAGRVTDAAQGQAGWLANILEASTT